MTITATSLIFTACSEEKKEEKSPAPEPAKKIEQKKAIVKPAKKATKIAVAKKDKGQTLELRIINGHLGKVILGLHEKATDGYDKGLDDMAPPPGMQTGYTALVPPDKKAYLYRDTRKPASEIEWIFYSKVYKDKAVKLAWNAKDIPSGYNFEIQQGEKTIDMRKTLSITIPKTDALLITAYKKSEAGKKKVTDK